MYKIYLGNQVIYDTMDKDTYPISNPVLKLPLKDAGSLEFKVFPDHPQFADLKIPFKLITVTRDDEEIFFGRTLRYSKTLDDGMSITCEGALAFLNDADMAKLENVSETVSAFFTRCITAYNSSVESAKQFVVGNVTVEQASSTEKFSVSNYQKINDVLNNQLANRFGGFFRIRTNPNGSHFIDYVDWADYTTTYNTKKVKIGENVISKEDKVSGEKVFTILRPIGEKDIDISSLSQSDVTIPNCTKSGNTLILTDLVTRYGTNITETVTTFKATTAAALLTDAENYITKIRSNLPSSVDINWVDFHYLNPTIDYVVPGDSFSNIEGFEGQVMTVTEVDLNLEDAGKDGFSIENSESIEIESKTHSTSGSASGNGSFSNYAGQQWKYYQETEKAVQIHTDKIEILAEEELTLAGKVTAITASEKLMIMVQNSGSVGNNLSLGFIDMHGDPSNWTEDSIDKSLYEAYTGQDGKTHYRDKNGRQVEEVVGSNLWLGRNHITAVAGKYEVVGDPTQPGHDFLRLDEGTTLQVKDTGAYVNVASKTDTGNLQTQITAQAGKISLVVEEVSGENVIKAASIVTAVNNSGSSVIISADHINLNGYVKATDLTTEWLKSVIAEIDLLEVNTLYGEYISVGNGLGGIAPDGTGFFTGITLDGSNTFTNCIIAASVSGDTLTLTPAWGNDITFTKATTLTGAWSGGVYVVTASPQGTTFSYDPPLRLNGSDQNSNFSAEIYESSSSATVARKSVYGAIVLTTNGSDSYVQVKKGSDGSGASVAKLSVGSLYTAGQNNVSIVKGSWSGGVISFTKSAGTASTKSVQLSQGTVTWDGNTASFPIMDGQGSTGYTCTVNAYNRYKAGNNDAYANQVVIGTCYTITAHNGDWVKVQEIGTGYSRVAYIQ